MKRKQSFLLLAALMSCSLYGLSQTVFSVKFQSEPSVKLAEVPQEAADLIVYKVSSDGEAGNNNGLWYFQAFPDSTTKRIFFVSDTSVADLKIYFTSNPANAGWVNTAKISLMN